MKQWPCRRASSRSCSRAFDRREDRVLQFWTLAMRRPGDTPCLCGRGMFDCSSWIGNGLMLQKELHDLPHRDLFLFFFSQQARYHVEVCLV